jgi:hypothetical protein
MKTQRLSILFAFTALLSSTVVAQSVVQAKRAIGPDSVIVTPKFGGTILGFDVDQNGAEGLLSESYAGGCQYATETFDQKTGEIVKVLDQGSGCGDDDVTRGIVGNSIGLVEHDHEIRFDYFRATYHLVAPVSGNQYTADWTPPGNERVEVWATSRNQGTPISAFQVIHLPQGLPYVGASDVATDRFGPALQVGSTPYEIGFNTKTNVAVLPYNSQPFGPTTLILMDVSNATTQTVDGGGSGVVQGIAVDSDDNVAVTATYGDAAVEWYDLAMGEEIAYQILPDCFSPACAGTDVEYDPIHRLFLVAQSITSQSSGQSSTIYVYDTQGTWQETLNGFNFYTSRFDVLPVHLALHPSDRSGYVDQTNSLGVGVLQSFTY